MAQSDREARVNKLLVDWTLIINQLRRNGSLEKVAREVNSCPQHLRRVARGETNEPKFSIGIKLLDLHYDLREQG